MARYSASTFAQVRGALASLDGNHLDYLDELIGCALELAGPHFSSQLETIRKAVAKLHRGELVQLNVHVHVLALDPAELQLRFAR